MKLAIISDKAVDVNAQEEGVVLRAYRDAVGVWTLGAGSTNADPYAVSVFGKIGPGVTCTREQAIEVMAHSLDSRYGARAKKALGPAATQHAIDAGAIFDYNTGAVHKASWAKAYKVGPDWAAVHAGLRAWNKAGGRVLAGLTRRREREFNICQRGEYGRLTGIKFDAGTKTVVPVESKSPAFLDKGDTGPEVRELNANLKKLGLAVDLGEVFNEKTDAAVRAFQKSHPQLTVDGRVGPATRAAIQRELDMVSKGKAAGTGGGTIATGGVIEAATTASVSPWVWTALAGLFVLVVVYIGYQYRDEIRAKLAR